MCWLCLMCCQERCLFSSIIAREKTNDEFSLLSGVFDLVQGPRVCGSWVLVSETIIFRYRPIFQYYIWRAAPLKCNYAHWTPGSCISFVQCVQKSDSYEKIRQVVCTFPFATFLPSNRSRHWVQILPTDVELQWACSERADVSCA